MLVSVFILGFYTFVLSYNYYEIKKLYYLYDYIYLYLILFSSISEFYENILLARPLKIVLKFDWKTVFYICSIFVRMPDS